jgi:predicted  nucleic acid-binding Zn-ribbon protein
MQNLIYLILIALSAGAGWTAGNWSGKDAKAALVAAQKLGEEAVAARDRIQAEADSKLKLISAEREAEVKTLRSNFETQTVGFNQKLADRDNRILALNKTASSERQAAANLKVQLANAKSPEERNALQSRIAEAEGRANKAETESIGVDCSKREVPAYLLADLRVAAP